MWLLSFFADAPNDCRKRPVFSILTTTFFGGRVELTCNRERGNKCCTIKVDSCY